jgi:ABC-type branched-subunit amino acid transport system ATPase component
VPDAVSTSAAPLLAISGIAVRFGGIVALNDVSFDVARGQICGLIGPNGAGKTTLFRMITGEETPDAGTLTLGDTVQLAYVDQSRDSLDPD